MKKTVAFIIAVASVISLQAAGEDPADICETELMACNSTCDATTPTENCYQECQDKYESCLGEADMEQEEPEGGEDENQKEE